MEGDGGQRGVEGVEGEGAEVAAVGLGCSEAVGAVVGGRGVGFIGGREGEGAKGCEGRSCGLKPYGFRVFAGAGNVSPYKPEAYTSHPHPHPISEIAILALLHGAQHASRHLS